MLHGSAMVLLFDVCSSAAMLLVSRVGFWAVKWARKLRIRAAQTDYRYLADMIKAEMRNLWVCHET